MKSHLQSYPSPLQINSFWNLGFLLGITIILQIITENVHRKPMKAPVNQKKGKLDKHLPVELACDYRKLLLMKQTSGLHWKVIATSGLVVECMCWMWKVM